MVNRAAAVAFLSFLDPVDLSFAEPELMVATVLQAQYKIGFRVLPASGAGSQTAQAIAQTAEALTQTALALARTKLIPGYLTTPFLWSSSTRNLIKSDIHSSRVEVKLLGNSVSFFLKQCLVEFSFSLGVISHRVLFLIG